ncbi:MAG TPA: hypothetical protein VN516_02125, partial [Candidatus Baltobacteraceae bacterium]|nr:hypothetical protein [Candidatus Baltobacteraceae bacterium]
GQMAAEDYVEKLPILYSEFAEATQFSKDKPHLVAMFSSASDLMGQMAAEDYVEKLPILYSEFAEATQFSKDKPHLVAMFSSAADLMQKTPAFWEKYVQIKLKRDFGGLYRFLNDPYPSGPNHYWERIDANIYKLRQQLSSVRS